MTAIKRRPAESLARDERIQAVHGSGLSRIDPRTGTRTLLDGSLDQPTSLVFVGREIWITEGQVLRLQAGQSPNLPFKVVQRRLDALLPT
jgi:hypothetical protein